ncbi:SAM-dependent methyltransferase [Amycolatopsis lurida]
MTATQHETPAHTGEVDVPWNLVVPEADIYLVGYGMRLPNDLTLEALAVLKRCTRVFGIPPIHAPDFGIPAMDNLFLRYGADKSRHQTYQEWLDIVLDAAAEQAPVALATYGSPMVGALVNHRILAEAPSRGLTTHVTNAASSLEGIWADLNIEPFYGVEIWEATVLVNQKIEPNTKANLMLPQAPVFGIQHGPDLATGLPMKTSSTITALRDHLLRFYPTDHPVRYIETGSGTRATTPHIETLPLTELDHPGDHTMSTLLVPRLTPHHQLDFPRPSQPTRPR